MNWWGKIIGGAFGFLVMGPGLLGVLLGAAIGHVFDVGMNSLGKGQWAQGTTERVQASFFTATFSIMGYLAKVDGRVTKDEIEMAGHVMDQMQLNPDQRKAAIVLFNQGKQSGFPVNAILGKFKIECARRSTLIQMFVEIQIMTVLADGVYHSEEKIALKLVAEHLGYSAHDLHAIMTRVQAAYAWEHVDSGYDQRDSYQSSQQAPANEIEYAYSILGVSSDATNAVIKKSYRRLMSQYHPDKLVSKGLPEEMMVLAKKKAQEITRAYNTIKKSR